MDLSDVAAATEDPASDNSANLEFVKSLLSDSATADLDDLPFADIYSEPALGIARMDFGLLVFGGLCSNDRIVGVDPNNEHRSVGGPNFGHPGCVVPKGMRVRDTWRHQVFDTKGVKRVTVVYRRTLAGMLVPSAMEVEWQGRPCCETFGITEEECRVFHENHGADAPESASLTFERLPFQKALKAFFRSSPENYTIFHLSDTEDRMDRFEPSREGSHRELLSMHASPKSAVAQQPRGFAPAQVQASDDAPDIQQSSLRVAIEHSNADAVMQENARALADLLRGAGFMVDEPDRRQPYRCSILYAVIQVIPLNASNRHHQWVHASSTGMHIKSGVLASPTVIPVVFYQRDVPKLSTLPESTIKLQNVKTHKTSEGLAELRRRLKSLQELARQYHPQRPNA